MLSTAKHSAAQFHAANTLANAAVWFGLSESYCYCLMNGNFKQSYVTLCFTNNLLLRLYVRVHS